MKCLIIAAGRGSRLERKGASKPLVPVLGKPLIERVICSAVQAGIDDFYVVTGYNGDKVCEFIDVLASGRFFARFTHISNEEWDKGNGLSVLKAQKYLDEPFMLLMGDHLVDPELLSRLRGREITDGNIILAVDRNLTNPLINMTDVTKVRIKDGKVVDIGKEIEKYNGFDTGIFYVPRQFLKALKKV